MRQRAFGPTGKHIPPIGQGTWQLRDKTAAEQTLRRGIELGLTHIDTAELYTGSEEVVGRAIKDARDRIFLVSKVLPKNASRKGTIAACERSLTRLQTDHLDVYLQHWNDETHPIEETMQAFGELLDRGLTRAIGVSNFDIDELEAAKSALGKHRIACNQVLYHLGARGIESDILPWCKKNDTALVGYSPFGSTGGFPSLTSKGGRTLSEVARRIHKTPHQVALAFLTRDPSTFTIPKAERIEHVEMNAGGDFELSHDDIERIDAAFPMTPGLTFL